jgi:hypothetical protein
MSLSLGLAALALVTAAGPAAPEKLKEDRILLCRPAVQGNGSSVPSEALTTAAKAFRNTFIDYGAPCEQDQESIGAAQRAGLRFAIRVGAEGKVGLARFTLKLNDARTEKTIASQDVDVPSGADAVEPLKMALADLSHSSPTSPGSSMARSATPWYLVAAGAAVMAVGAGFALAAGSAASSRDGSNNVSAYISSDANWRKYKTMSGVSLGIGGAAVAAGLAWRFAF